MPTLFAATNRSSTPRHDNAGPFRNAWLKARIGFVAALFAVSLAACDLVRQVVEEPELSVTRLEMVNLGLLQQNFIADLDVFNPNSFALPMRGFTWNLSLEGVTVIRGNSNLNQNIPAGGTVAAQLAFNTDLISSLAGLFNFIVNPQPDLDYRITGVIRTGLSFAPEIEYSHEGTVRLSR